STPLPQDGESGGQGSGGEKVSGTTLLDAAHQHAVSGDRSHREQPAGAPGRRELGRWVDWALSPLDRPVPKTACGLGKRKAVFHFRTGPAARGSHRRIMVEVGGRIDGWWNDAGSTVQ